MNRIPLYIKRTFRNLPIPTNNRDYIDTGFVCRNAYGEIDNLERGGSDYTASILGAYIGRRNTDMDRYRRHAQQRSSIDSKHFAGKAFEF